MVPEATYVRVPESWLKCRFLAISIDGLEPESGRRCAWKRKMNTLVLGIPGLSKEIR